MKYKINQIKSVKFLKSLQIIFSFVIFAFLLTTFITSLFASNEYKISSINSKYFTSATIGLINFDWSLPQFHHSLSTYAISYLVILSIFIILFITNMIYIRVRFFYLKTYFYFFLIFIILVIIVFFSIYLSSFSSVYINSIEPTNFARLNPIINYSIIAYNNNYLLFNAFISNEGIIYCVIISCLIITLFYFPLKITYNLIKNKYI